MPVNNPAAASDLVGPESFQTGFGTLEVGTENELLHELFERRAAQFPEAIALECGASRLTYAEVERRTNQLARFLRAGGVSSSDCVGLLLPRSADVCLALLGILKSGA